MYNIFFIISLNLFLIIKPNNEYSININTIRNLNSDDSNKKNVIISIIKGYSWNLIKPFFISLLEAKIKTCDLIMFVENLSEETLNKIK